MLGSVIRRQFFWLFDAIKGGRIRKHCKDIDVKNNCEKMPTKQLESILNYARKNVPFYNNISAPKIDLFPVMSKEIYKQQGKNVVSQEFDNLESLYKTSTSGSTGTPLVVYQCPCKRQRLHADLIRAHESVGWKLGDHYVFIRNWVSNYKQSPLKKIAQNVRTVNISDFNGNKKVWLCKHLKKHKNSVLFGYASSICDFMFYVRNQNIDGESLKLKLIVCDSDELTKQNKQNLMNTFGCPVINRYDNEENGLLAISMPYKDEMIVNFSSLYIELLKLDCDEHVSPGEVGRVVVTDLFNHAMPLIRYDIGDLAVSYDEIGKIRTLSEFSGRKADCIYSTDGILISSVAISGITEIFSSIVKYQLIQTTQSSYIFKYIGELSEIDYKELDSRLHTSLGGDATIDFQQVKELSLGKNGKFKTVVCNI